MSIIEVKNLEFVYGKNTPYEKKALDDINFSINEGEFVGIVGSTGSGKSTLVQHINGLIKLQSGNIEVLDINLSDKKPNLKLLRQGVGMLFQYPEYQLFADTVLQDVMFGPTNFDMDKEEAKESAINAIKMVGLDYEAIKERSPLELSGGQKRRVAMAGVLAYKPQILVLDEPTAGLDPKGKKEMLDLITSLKGNMVKTIIMVSHNMDEISKYTSRVIVLNNSKLIFDTTPADLFYNNELEEIDLLTPHIVRIVKQLNQKGFNLSRNILTEQQLVNELKKTKAGSNE
ncbi:MAG: energy-coupling factor transporter ATPase [Clostridia bacterium]